MNANLVALGVFGVHLAVLGVSGGPPGTPSEGDRWIVGNGTGAWAGHDDEVAVYLGGVWLFWVPKAGWSAVNLATGFLAVYRTGGVWEEHVRVFTGGIL